MQPGDTAWDLAATHLGSGSQWSEIVKANDGKIQPDGGALRVGENPFLEPGWKLTIPGVPAPDTAPQDAEQQYETVTVERGQSLSSIADEHLGDADRWPEIAEASAHITQPGGYHLEDPDQIDIGWTLRVPTDAPGPAHQADEQPSHQEETPSSEEAAADAAEAAKQAVDAASDALPAAEAPQADTAADAAPAGAETPAPASAPSAEAEETSTVPWTGVGSIFAASIPGAIQ